LEPQWIMHINVGLSILKLIELDIGFPIYL